MVSVLVSFCPTYVRSYEEWRNVAFLAHVLMPPADLDRFGRILANWGFGQVSMKELTEDGEIPQDETTYEEEEPVDLGPWSE